MSTQAIIFLIVIGFSILSSAYKKYQEQAEKNRIASARRRAEEEALRTGRPQPDPAAMYSQAAAAPPPPGLVSPGDEQSERARELVARRQALVAELRRRAAAKQGGGGGSTAAPVAHPPLVSEAASIFAAPVSPVSAAPSVTPGMPPLPTRAARVAPPVAAPQPASKPRQGEQRSRGDRGKRSQQENRSQESRSSRQENKRPTPLRAAAAETAVVPQARAVSPDLARLRILGGSLSLAELRRAVVLQELLSPPVGLRDNPTGAQAV